MRKICYVTGTRADFGLMQSTLMSIHNHPELSLGLLVTGMHLLPAYGETWREIAGSGLSVDAKIPVSLTGESGAEMACAVGEQVVSFTQVLDQNRPDLLLLLGDRGEMLAGAIAALYLNIPLVHIHGGELSGTVDESIRHAVSKLSHYHFTATEKSRERLIRMGERPEHIMVTGAPGLDGIYQAELLAREPLFGRYGLDKTRPLLLVLFHPVVQQAGDASAQMQALLEVAIESDMQTLVVMPNADAGGAEIVRVIRDYAHKGEIKTVIHLPRNDFLSLVAEAEVMVGNSSSGIIETASLGTPVVNIGDRQQCRERNANVIDVAPIKGDIARGLTAAKEMKGQCWSNAYGEGKASERIVECLATLSLDPKILEKVNAY